jgi:peptide/nickel transport system permease protein
MDPILAGNVEAEADEAGAPVASVWKNRKLIAGGIIVGVILVGTLIGRLFWDTALARAASSPLNRPPFWLDGGSLNHPLGTENAGRDMLALIVVGGPTTLQVGLIVALISMVVGVAFGFLAGYLGGMVDTAIRILSDTALTIPTLAIMIVIAAYIPEMNATSMALIIALFAWAAPTRMIRAQVLSIRERGYVRMARLSAQSNAAIMFQEMLPNLLPYLAASFIGSMSNGILAAVGLEALGLGPQRVPTLGMVVSQAIEGSAILRGMWWWWGFPAVILVVIFIGLFLIAIGLDEIANPRLRGART